MSAARHAVRHSPTPAALEPRRIRLREFGFEEDGMPPRSIRWCPAGVSLNSHAVDQPHGVVAEHEYVSGVYVAVYHAAGMNTDVRARNRCASARSLRRAGSPSRCRHSWRRSPVDTGHELGFDVAAIPTYPGSTPGTRFPSRLRSTAAVFEAGPGGSIGAPWGRAVRLSALVAPVTPRGNNTSVSSTPGKSHHAGVEHRRSCAPCACWR